MNQNEGGHGMAMTNYERQKAYVKRHPDRANACKLNNYRARQFGPGRRPWTSDDIREIHTSSLTDTELGKKLGRSVMAIQIKRSRTTPPLPSET